MIYMFDSLLLPFVCLFTSFFFLPFSFSLSQYLYIQEM
ncbi:hypothetical protein CsSME_00023772 [Camellia sinensis var. sinensis]